MAGRNRTRNETEPAKDRKLFDPLSVVELRHAAMEGKYDPGVYNLLEEELDYIKRKREGASLCDLAGLALSGGGIRSATFALGVMQALAKEGVLKRMDYLSTVSGGGYIGSALTWFLGAHNKERKFGLDAKTFPFGTDAGGKDASEDQRNLTDWLRQHGNYLTPGKGITLVSGIAVILRGILLNLIVWVPIGIAVFWALLSGTDFLVQTINAWWGSPVTAVLQKGKNLTPAMLSIAGLCALLFTSFCIAYSYATARRKEKPSSWRYSMRLFFERYARWPLWIILATMLVASLPFANSSLQGWLHKAGGPLAAALGLLSGVWSFLQTKGSRDRPLPTLVPILGAALILYGISLLSFQLALILPADPSDLPLWSWLILGNAIVSGLIVNINYVSIHRFYRDRLMETFMPDVDQALQGNTGASILANSATIQSMIEGEHSRGPYHIVNANVVLVASEEPRWKLRGGDSFILTPKRCGSSATGWIASDRFLGGRLTLATAMSISGAAANPNTGADGVGLTRSRSVSLLMALLNLRLGYWTCNPRYGSGWMRPNHFVPGLMQAFGLHREDSKFIELSDGGHFDNLALYELIRRRLRLIILCDGAADPNFSFADLDSLRRRIAADFEASIEFTPGPDPDALMPKRFKELAPNDAGYAVDADMAKTAHTLARITYADGSTGALVYIKTTMVDSLSFGVKAYKGSHHDFPDQTTADQFFNEEQFDAYRELGRHLGLEMLKETGLAKEIEQIISKGDWPRHNDREKDKGKA